TCRPLQPCVERLLDATACRMLFRQTPRPLPDTPLAEPPGHLAVAVDDDGRRCRVWDERGQPVPFDRLLLLLARIVLPAAPQRRPVVLDEALPPALSATLRHRGLDVRHCDRLPGQMYAAMSDSGAARGADRPRRLWYAEPGKPPIADALVTLALLLARLSQTDAPLSQVLDGDGADH
ncbi:MAG: hypothetical protein ACYC6Y_32070, partial [Thermoguttaceae bacterium]